jgi:hypothetical protein
MISPATRAQFEQLLLSALQEGLPAPWRGLALLQPLPALAQVRDTQAVMLSIATFRCRLHVLVHHGLQPRLHRVFGPAQGEETGEAVPLTDRLAEYGNLVCGAINRELGRSWHYAGMSTPSHLTGQVLDHLDLLRDQHQIHAEVSVEGERLLGASLLIGSHAPFDFQCIDAPAGQTAGELEFF